MKHIDLETNDPLYTKPIKKMQKNVIFDNVETSKIVPKTKMFTEDTTGIIKKPVLKIGKNLDSYIFPQINITPKGSADQIDWLPMFNKCGSSHYYRDSSLEGYFLRDNLFSELVTEYERSEARFNLGIGEEYSMTWGNIKGDISKNSDLYNFIINTIREDIQESDTDFLKLFEDFTNEVNYKIYNKVDKFNGKMYGKPITTLPKEDDNSSRIPTTEWVNARINMNTSIILKWVMLSEDHMFMDETAKDIKVLWEFANNDLIEELLIMGLPQNPVAGECLIEGLNEDTIISFSYKSEGKEYNKFLSFNKLHAFYYGVGVQETFTTKTKHSSIIVDLKEGNYVYLYLPKENARISVDNIYGGFIQLSTSIKNGIRYYLYRSVNSGLGKLHINYDG